MLNTTCPSATVLSAYLLGKLPPTEAEGLFAHLDQCPLCEVTIADLETAPHEDTLLSSLARPSPVDPYEVEPECQAAVSRAEALADPGRPAAPASAEGPGTDSIPLETLGEYRLLEKLGQGGMGTVYKALHTKLDRVVALKVLAQGRVHDARRLARFEREMKAVGRLNHPNIVQAHDAREIEGTTVLVMEYVDGLDLSELVRLCGRLSIADACELARQAAEGLEYAHQQGLVHRDIKPSNLMLTTEGRVKILDFGLALLHYGCPCGEEVTRSGHTMGTADYIAPEQVTDSHQVDVRADVYSLGCTLYKLLCAQAPFGSSKYQGTFEKLTAHVHDEVPSIKQLRGEISGRLVAVLDRMLAKNPDERFATPGEAATALERFARDSDLADLSRAARQRAESAAETRGSLAETQSGAAPPPTGPPAPMAPPPPVTGVPANRRWKPWAVAAALLLCYALVPVAAHIVVKIRKGDEEIRIELPDGATAEIITQQEATKPAAPSRADLVRSLAERFPDGPAPAVAPFDAPQAQRHQQAWAGYSGNSLVISNSIGMELVLIPPGAFEMGSSTEEVRQLLHEAQADGMPNFFLSRIRSEAPKRWTPIVRSFYLGKHEVTVGQFRQFVEATGYVTDAEDDQDAWTNWSSYWSDIKEPERHPVVHLTCGDALAFCRWLSKKEGRTYRLPTEAEWEYACRAGTTTPWNCGRDPEKLRRVANVGDLLRRELRPPPPMDRFHHHHAPWEDGYALSAPVGSFEPNGFGLYDMHGNVAEMCGNMFQHFSRGAGWGRYWPLELRSAYRGGPNPAGVHYCDVGFRVVYDPDAPLAQTPPELSVAPVPAEVARRQQQDWAKHLGLPAESTNTIGMTLALIPPGEFAMGATEAEIGEVVAQSRDRPGEQWYLKHIAHETPQHRVQITRPFYFGIHEVTVGQFRRFVRATGYRTDAEREYRGGYRHDLESMNWEYDPDLTWNNPGFPKDDQHPVVMVTWDDAAAFCQWLSGQEGETYRLPTEAEWEYAARAGSDTRYYFGDDPADLEAHAWCGLNSGGGTHPVGEKQANPWGLHDVFGNANEWCRDGYDADYYRRSPQHDPPGPVSFERRVQRGGDWYSIGAARSAFRYHEYQKGRNNVHGFRVVCEIFREPVGAETELRVEAQVEAESEVSPEAKEADQGGGREDRAVRVRSGNRNESHRPAQQRDGEDPRRHRRDEKAPEPADA